MWSPYRKTKDFRRCLPWISKTFYSNWKNCLLKMSLYLQFPHSLSVDTVWCIRNSANHISKFLFTSIWITIISKCTSFSMHMFMDHIGPVCGAAVAAAAAKWQWRGCYVLMENKPPGGLSCGGWQHPFQPSNKSH